MKTVFYIIVILIALFYALGTKIEFKPFKIEFTNWVSVIGWILLFVGVLVLTTHSAIKSGEEYYIKGYKQGAEDLRTELLNEIKNAKSNEETSTSK